MPLHSSCSVCNAVYILRSHTSLCQITRKRNIWTPNHFVPLIKSHFSPVKATTTNISRVSDPDLKSPIKKQITQKNVSSNNDSNLAQHAKQMNLKERTVMHIWIVQLCLQVVHQQQICKIPLRILQEVTSPTCFFFANNTQNAMHKLLNQQVKEVHSLMIAGYGTELR